MSGPGTARERTGHGHGKAIVSGEHLVLDGAAALVVPLRSLRASVAYAPGAEPLTLSLPASAAPPSEGAGELAAVKQTLESMWRGVCAAAGRADDALTGTLAVRSEVPIGRGLGSSAAIAAAMVRAAGVPPEAQWATARAAEDIVHGRSSGLDPAAALTDDALLFARGAVLQRVRVNAALADARWVLVDVGAARPTRDAIDRAIIARGTMGPAATARLVRQVDDASRSAARALASGDLDALAAAMHQAGAALEPLDVVDLAMRAMMARVADASAMAVKQTGAGLGGMLLALCRTQADAGALVATLGADGHKTHVVGLLGPDDGEAT